MKCKEAQPIVRECGPCVCRPRPSAPANQPAEVLPRPRTMSEIWCGGRQTWPDGVCSRARSCVTRRRLCRSFSGRSVRGTRRPGPIGSMGARSPLERCTVLQGYRSKAPRSRKFMKTPSSSSSDQVELKNRGETYLGFVLRKLHTAPRQHSHSCLCSEWIDGQQ